MRVVIAGGRSRADYLMGALAETVDTVVAINDDRRFCEYLSSRHDGTVIWGNGMKLAVLEEAGVAGFDAIVALTGLDADNLAICQVAKKFLGIRIQLCIVSNPENTAIFRQLGVTAAISATATLAQAIRGALELPDPADAKASGRGGGGRRCGRGRQRRRGRRRRHRRRRGRPRCPLALPLDSGLVAPLGKRAPVTVMGKTRGDNLAAAIALGEPGGERSGPGPLLARYVGVAVMFVGLAGLAPLAVLPAYPDEVALAPCFIFPGIGAAMAGYLVYFASPDPAPGARLTRGQAAACTVLVWVLAIAVYALPYVAAGLLSPVQAVFESTSGLTTTGLSVVDVDTCPAIFLFHRSLTCYLGGVGLVLILTCVVTQTGGLGVYNAEGHTDHLLPSAAKTARMILLIYNGLIIAGAVAYWAAGMTPFDAINISMCAVPTGGFATHGESIAYWNSPVIEAITIVLMVAGGTNFLLLFLLLRGKLKAFLTHIETPLYFGTIAVMALVVAGFFLGQGVSGDGAEALRQGTFQVVSILTSTGFQTIPSFADLGPALLFLFGLLMLVGAEARSTSGGIKLYRVAVASLGLGHDLHERYGNKRHVTSIKINRFGKRSVLTEVDVAEAQTYVVLYLLLCAAGAFALILCGATLQEAVFDFVSCLGSTGVGTGFLGAESGPAPLLIGSAGMLLGRLEIIPLFMGVGTLASLIRKGVRHGR